MHEIIEYFQKHDYKVEDYAVIPVDTLPTVETVYQIAVTKDDQFQVDLAVDAEKNLLVVNNLDCPVQRLGETLQDLTRVTAEFDPDTVLVQGATGRYRLWQDYGFYKHYQCIITGTETQFATDRIDQSLDQTARNLATQLGEEVEVYEVAADLPYIYSVEIVDRKAQHPDAAQYHCDLHYHQLTGAVYLDRLWLAEDKRHQGLGTATVEILKETLVEVGANYLYLRATESSESFWNRYSEFTPCYRLNQRWARRMRRQLRREPGWDRVYVRGVKLANPLDYYGNHPGEDWDFFQAQEMLRLNRMEENEYE